MSLTCKRPWPFTIARFTSQVRAAEAAGAPIPMHVQLRKHGEVLCGRLVEVARGDAVDFVKVDTLLGTEWASARNVRQCSGLDGKCVCARADLRSELASGSASARSVTPLGNTGTTVEEAA